MESGWKVLDEELDSLSGSSEEAVAVALGQFLFKPLFGGYCLCRQEYANYLTDHPVKSLGMGYHKIWYGWSGMIIGDTPVIVSEGDNPDSDEYSSDDKEAL